MLSIALVTTVRIGLGIGFGHSLVGNVRTDAFPAIQFVRHTSRSHRLLTHQPSCGCPGWTSFTSDTLASPVRVCTNLGEVHGMAKPSVRRRIGSSFETRRSP